MMQSSQHQLRQLVEQIERLDEEKKALCDDIKDKFLEAKGVGFDVKVLRRVLKLRKMSESDRQEQDAILDTYKVALGMAGTPLWDAVVNSEHVQ